jgi:hypothetical protein
MSTDGKAHARPYRASLNSPDVRHRQRGHRRQLPASLQDVQHVQGVEARLLHTRDEEDTYFDTRKGVDLYHYQPITFIAMKKTKTIGQAYKGKDAREEANEMTKTPMTKGKVSPVNRPKVDPVGQAGNFLSKPSKGKIVKRVSAKDY